MELIARHAYMMKCPYKSPKYRVQRASELVKTSKYWEGGVFQLHGDRACVFEVLLDLPPPYCFIWLFVVV